MDQRQRNDLEGRRVSQFGRAPIYVVIDGFLRWIPNPTTMNALFRDWSHDEMDLTDIIGYDELKPDGPCPLPLPDSTALVKAAGRPEVYLLDFNNLRANPPDGRIVKRHIMSPTAMDRYNLSWDKISEISPVAIDAIPEGIPMTG
jgi:hypothetical protein